MNKIGIKKSAFTLVELLVALGLSSFLLLTTYSVYTVGTKGFRKSAASAELTQNARISLERLTREIRQNIDILSPLPATPDDGAPLSEIKFQDGHNYWPGIGKIQYITYKLNGTDLERTVSHYSFAATPDDWVLASTRDANNNAPLETSEPSQIKAQNVTELKFWGTKTITISLTVSDGAQTYHFQTKALGRNIQ